MRISLANKCQLLFGTAVIVILAAALSVVWHRMQTLVGEDQIARGRQITDLWLSLGPEAASTMPVVLINRDQLQAEAGHDPFLAQALAWFNESQRHHEFFQSVRDPQGKRHDRYARAIRRSQRPGHKGSLQSPLIADPVQQVLLLELDGDLAKRQLMVNRIYIVAAGLLAGLLAIGVFWFITMRIILSPVRVLHNYAQKVAEGDLNIRADVNTGDEYEQLCNMFNTMLDRIRDHADQLRMTNKSLDLKLGELAETNVALYEANKVKGEFLANVSHELRTPLNSIVGFAEVLGETLADRTGPVDEKRKRYIGNIIHSSRQLLDLINDLLDLAKIEAGRMELNIAPMSIRDTAEGLITLIRPQADKRHIDLQLKVKPNLPMVQTDAGKVQQIVFNFLANAVKFTPDGGTITLSAQVATQPDNSFVRFTVTDTGPGIAREDHQRIFDKFIQLDSSVTREHLGTGLGLTISRDLAQLLQGRIELDSDAGRGASFSLVLPLTLVEQGTPLMPDA